MRLRDPKWHLRRLMRGFHSSCSARLPAKKDLSQEMQTVYDSSEVERDWYSWWESQGFFRRRNGREKFVMILPPPNVTGNLHLGHALTVAIQDAITRWQQMRGNEVVWVPGCDHASIATQVVVERHLWSTRQITRHQLGRERFLEEVWSWKHEKVSKIYDQIKRLGASLDWDRALFTMDDQMSEAVREAFIQLFDSGLIYRGNCLVNWCCTLQSAVSDIEVEHILLTGPTNLEVPGYESAIEFGKIYDFAYKVYESDEEMVVSTTRPETILGDTAVMVHPEDERYMHLHNKHVLHPLRGQLIPVIVDPHVDPEFGTGVVKVTPGHDHDDFEVGQRHQLPKLTIFDEQGRINDSVPDFKHQPRFVARKTVVEALDQLGLYRGSRSHPMTIPLCSRTQDIIEPLLKPQWFIKCKDMASMAVASVQSEALPIHPESHIRKWCDWLRAGKDWCVSRQLWWGHRIPMYHLVYGDKKEKWVAAHSENDAKTKLAHECGIQETSITSITQEEDVLDTWFSSGLIPFAAFGWPHNTRDFQNLYPTTLMETGHDILVFWVAPMVMLGLQLTGELPFKRVLLHGIVCDSHGRKMSKSRGNIIDPMDVIDGASIKDLSDNINLSQKKGLLSDSEATLALQDHKRNFPNGIPMCGTDALRFALCSSNVEHDMTRLDVTGIEQSKFFCNKIWQTVRFLLYALDKTQNGASITTHVQYDQRETLTIMDRWILSHLSHLVTFANKNFENNCLHRITNAFDAFWRKHLCDVYLESIKPAIYGGSERERTTALCTLWSCVDVGIHILSPFMPFLTEELYQRLPRNSEKFESIMQCDYPRTEDWMCWKDEQLEDGVAKALEVASSFRNIKARYSIRHNDIQGSVVTFDPEMISWLRAVQPVISHLGWIRSFIVTNEPSPLPAFSPVDVLSEKTFVYLHLAGVIDPQKELKRLYSQTDKLEKKEEKVLKKLTGLKKKPPQHVLDHLNDQLEALRKKKEKVASLISELERL